MTITDHQAKYFSHLLTRKTASNDREKLVGVFMDAQVEPKPHQIDAALFSFRSPFSKGAILADEVGLGKTIEAGIILSQYWAEHKRKLLVVAPANLRQQWSQELRSKFFLDSEILDSKKVNAALDASQPLFNKAVVYIVSYDFARRFAEVLSKHRWDLLVIDEAHRLRNVYKPDNVTANTIKKAFENTPKLLLTATPLQNSLLEVYGLVSIIDKNFFGNFDAFKDEFVTGLGTGPRANKKLLELQKRLEPVVKRSLRKQVKEYINYTKRVPLTQTFAPAPKETELYNLVTEYLGREQIYAFSSSQRALTSLLILKLLGSSAYAISATLERIAARVEAEANEGVRRDTRGHKILQFDDDIEESVEEDLEDDFLTVPETEARKLSQAEITAMKKEAEELRDMSRLAREITEESKGEALRQALGRGFKEMEKLNANRKAIIFTESTRTQEYLMRLLTDNGFNGKVVAFNGSGGGEQGTKIYQDWLERHKESDKVSGVKTADQRAAIVEYFQNEAEIMVATEAAGEGINLQFCSLVINYDLPWNPQRVEQRIGRCHRYGQKSDVVVINFFNEHNRAEQRILELLDEKFQLFNGVFGASDPILGVIESGFDFERKIADIVRTCRTTQQIEQSFDKLQQELSDKIESQIQATRKALLDNLDVEVQEKLKVSRDESNSYLSRYEQWLWNVLKYKLADVATFEISGHAFRLPKTANAQPGRYYLDREEQEGHKLRLQHPLVEEILASAKTMDLPRAALSFQYTNSGKVIRALEQFVGQSGTLTIKRFALSSPAQTEEYFPIAAKTHLNESLPADIVERMLELPASASTSRAVTRDLKDEVTKSVAEIKRKAKARDKVYLKEEGLKLDAWASDMRRAAKLRMEKLDSEIRELRRSIREANDIEGELKIRQQLRKLEKRRDELEYDYRNKIREIEEKTDTLLATIESNLSAKESLEELFTIEWELK